MKLNKSLCLLICMLCATSASFAQLKIGAKYFDSSHYSNSDDTHTGSVKSHMITGSLNLPLSIKISPNQDTVRVWTGFISGKYLKMNESKTIHNYDMDKILNLNLGFMHYRNLNDRWYLSLAGGVGLSTHDTRFSGINWQNVMLYGMGIAIYKINDELSVGAGLLLTNAFNIPLVAPGFYIKWKKDGKYNYDLSSTTYDIMSSFGIRFNPKFSLSTFLDITRISTPIESSEGKDYYYSFNSLTTGLRPEIKVSKHIAILVETGLAFGGSGSYKRRQISSLLKKEETYQFDPCFYVSVGLQLGVGK